MRDLKTVRIAEVGIDPALHLSVRPSLASSEDYQFIYRDASWVRWDGEKRLLYVVPDSWTTALDDFRTIVAAIRREYGQQLAITGKTVFTNVPEELVVEMKQIAG